MPGTLYVVATPIGNLEDFTFRALRTLKSVDLIAAEDTRRTAKLLAHYEIQRPVVSVREHNEGRQSGRLVERMLAGESIALVSDAGTPLLADPGAGLVSAARHAGIRVVPIPGPSAITAALSAAGLPADEFVFLGFPPSSGRARENWLERLAGTHQTVVFFEAPHRIERTIAELSEILANRPSIVCRELTKINEEMVTWPNTLDNRGEFVIIVGPPEAAHESAPEDAASVADFFQRISEATDLDEDNLLPLVATRFGVSLVKARSLVKKGRIALKRSRDNQQDE